ncbi:MAG: alpha/beta hydrolase [Phycisphaerae bacterium]
MIVVMPLGYGDDRVVSRTGPGLGNKRLFSRNMHNSQAQMFTEIMPPVAKHYPIKTGLAHTAIAGLSMGGGEALMVGLNNLHSFGWVCGLGSYCGTNGPDFSRVFPHLTSQDHARIKLLWIACGRHDPIVLKENRNLDAWLTARDIQFKSIWTTGGHQWRGWRDNFIHLAPLLFQM